MNKVKKQQRNKINNILPFVPEGDFYFTKGVEAFQKKKFDFSLKWLKKAIETQPNNPLYNCQMSIVYTETGAYHLANQLLNNVLQTSEYVDCYYLLANNYAHLGLLDDATKFARIYLEKEPDGDFNEEAHALLELIDFELEDDDFDEDWLLEADDDLLKYQETAFYYMENENWDKAMPIIEEMLVLYPDHLIVKHDYAQALFYTGSEEKAIQLEHKLLSETNHSLQSYMNLTLFYYEMGQKNEYNEMLRLLLNVYPFHVDLQIKLAVTLAKTGNYREALKHFKKIDQHMARGHLTFYKWFSIAAYYIGEERLAVEIWEEGCLRHRTLEKHDLPWND